MQPRFALILVRNTVTHDARILREADTLGGLGFEVLIAGVVSTRESERELEIAGHRVLRLDPGGGVRRLLARLRRGTPSHAQPPRTVGGGGDAPAVHDGRAAARRIFLTAAYYLQGTKLVWRTSPALVHANDYNTMWIALIAKLLRGSRVVYDTHELWPDRNRRPEWRPWLLACEALFVRAADATVTTSPGYAELIAERYRVAPPTVVRNIPLRRTSAGQGADRAQSGAPVAAYIGGLMPGRGLEPAIRALAHAPDIRLRLIGPGDPDYRARLADCAERAGVAERVEILAAVPPDQLLDAVSQADIGLMLIEPICRSYELTLPNKLFEYAAAGLPILGTDLPVIGAIVRSEQLGEVAPIDDPARIAQAMQQLADPAVNAAAREHVRAFAASETWEREQLVLEGIYQGLRLRG